MRSHDPVTRLAGLALEFVTRVVVAPLATYLTVDTDHQLKLAAIKTDPVLVCDPAKMERECIETIAMTRPVLGIMDGFGQSRIVDTSGLNENQQFVKSEFAHRFLAEHGLGPMLVLVMKSGITGSTCLIVLTRSVEEHEFNEREKGFLRQIAPLLTHSWACAGGDGSPQYAAESTDLGVLTHREVEIARLVATGERNESIAAALHIAPGTVKCHVHNIYSKLGVDSRVHLSLLLAEH